MKTLVVTPLKKELKSLVSVFNDVTPTFYGFSNDNFDFSCIGMGSAEFKENLKLKIKDLAPNFVICAGSCGGIRDFKTLDVVEVSSVSKRLGGLIESDVLEANQTYFSSLEKACCGSGDESVLSATLKNKLLENLDTQIVTWETYSFFEVMKNTKIPFSELRVVTDLADDEGLNSFNKNISKGMQKIGTVIRDFKPY